MCAPTVFTTAPTVSRVVQSDFEHTLNVRLSPTTGGAAGAGCGTSPGTRADVAGPPYRRDRASSRSERSNATATGPRAVAGRPVGSGENVAALANGAAASGVADCSLNSADPPSVPPVDQGSTRYSAVSADVLAANVTQPESVAGLMDVYAATASESCVPPAPQDGRGPGPAEDSAHPTKAKTPAQVRPVCRTLMELLNVRRG